MSNAIEAAAKSSLRPEAMASASRLGCSGTTATDADGQLVGGGDAAAQMEFGVDKIGRAIVALGGRLEDVERTRVFVRDIAKWEAVARVHGRRFGHIRPVNTLVEARLVGPQYLVELAAEAIASLVPDP